MPLPTHRLNLLLVPADPERRPDSEAAARLFATLRAWEVLDARDRPGPAAARLAPGGFALFRLDLPPLPVLYGNHGFHARCPQCGANLVAALSPALHAWRAGGPASLRCPACEAFTALGALDYRPTAAPGRFALELRDVDDPSLHADAAIRALLGDVLGTAWVEVASRGP